MEFHLINNLPVLIIGAGPTGLMMASILAHYGITFRIIDKKPERTLASNATWIQTRTLDLLDQMGILKKFLKIGQRCDAINFYEEGKFSSQLSLKYIDSIYPFILTLPQSKTEELLEEHLKELNYSVERDIELVDIQYDLDNVTSTLKFANGHTDAIISNWLIACDGANSIVREKCGFHFLGEDLTEQFMVADATINFSYIPKDEMHFFFDPGTVLAAFPLGSNRYRLAGNLQFDSPRKSFYEKEVIDMVQERAHGNYYVTDVSWVSPFWIHGKISESLRKGPIFLAGDAAHIYSPAGGQGMNTGIQDAYNLAWKLALVIQGKAKSSMLDSYQIERYPAIQEAVEQNEFYTKLALFDRNFLTKLKKFSSELSNNNPLNTKIGNQLTQLNIKYEESPIINYECKSIIKPGQRAPNVKTNKTTIYHYLNNIKHHLLIFIGKNPTDELWKNISTITKYLENQFINLFSIHIIYSEQLNNYSTILDNDGHIHDAYQIQVPTIYIIRPDTYIAHVSEDFNVESLDKFLKLYFVNKD